MQSPKVSTAEFNPSKQQPEHFETSQTIACESSSTAASIEMMPHGCH
jgi:hypothetical protein